MSLSKLIQMQSCFLVELSPDDITSIRDEPFLLACGETLRVGDCFTEIGSSGSAGNQPVRLTPPWVQRYRGLLTAQENNFNWLWKSWGGQDLVLFDAFNSEDTKEGFVFPGRRAKWDGTRGRKDGYYLAYLRFCDNQLFHTRGGASSSVCKCTSLTRWFPKKETSAQAKGAYITHSLRRGSSENKIKAAIQELIDEGKRVTKTSVSRRVGLSREHINRNYQYLFS